MKRIVNYKVCNICGKEIGSTAFTRHQRSCKGSKIEVGEKDEHGKTQLWYEAMQKRKGNGTNQFTKAEKEGLEKPIVSEDTKEKLREKALGRQLSDETKHKVSEGMKKAHSEGRAWNIGMSRWNNEPSYPEKFFMKVILNHFDDKNYIREYPFSKYSLDFAWVDKKKCIEIDGDQHQRFDDYKKRDSEKDALLKENGWIVLRISWKDFYNHTKDYISIAKDFIDN